MGENELYLLAGIAGGFVCGAFSAALVATVLAYIIWRRPAD
jgi:hypothetical protein